MVEDDEVDRAIPDTLDSKDPSTELSGLKSGASRGPHSTTKSLSDQ